MVIISSSAINLVYCDFQQCLKKQNYDSDIIIRSDAAYSTSNFQFQLRNLTYPLGYLQVKSNLDVQKVVHCAKQHNVHVSVLCGGHSFEKYSYGSNNSWIINLSSLTEIKINTKLKTVKIGAGNRIKGVTEYLWKNGKYGVTVGTCPSVGISGFALGGGFGLTARKYGLLVDQTVAYEIVTANGRTKLVTKKTNSDLFWALRGAGAANFGVVTNFYLKLFDASNVYIWVIKRYYFSHFSKILYTWQKWVASGVDNSVTSNFGVYNSILKTFNVTFVINNNDIGRSETQLLLIHKWFPNITSVDIFRGSYIDMIYMTSTPFYTVNTTAQFYSRSKGFYVSNVLNETEVKSFATALQRYPFFGFLFEMYGGVINDRKRAETAFVHRTSLYVIQIGVSVKMVNRTLEETIALGEQYEKELKNLIDEIQFMSNGEHYQNYPDRDLPDWFKQYYRENGNRLTSIKRRVDPENFFRYEQSIPFNV